MIPAEPEQGKPTSCASFCIFLFDFPARFFIFQLNPPTLVSFFVSSAVSPPYICYFSVVGSSPVLSLLW